MKNIKIVMVVCALVVSLFAQSALADPHTGGGGGLQLRVSVHSSDSTRSVLLDK